eukprot:2069892-Amphidinium_carterae.4
MLHCYSDSNWCGCEETRKRTGCAMVFWGNLLPHAHSRKQTARALSSGEAEWYGCCTGAVELLYSQQLLRNVGINVDTLQLYTDATVAKSLAARQGLSRIRYLKLQDLTGQKKISVLKVTSTSNPADMDMKHVDVSILKKHWGMVGLGGEHEKDKRRHFVQSANSISTVIMSTLLTTLLTLPQRARFRASSLVVAGLQASTAGAGLLTEDSLVGAADDTTVPTYDSSQASTGLLVLSEGHMWLAIGLVTLISLLTLIGTCYMGQPICGPCPVPSEEDSSERDDQVPRSLPNDSTAPRRTGFYLLQNDCWGDRTQHMQVHAYQTQFV